MMKMSEKTTKISVHKLCEKIYGQVVPINITNWTDSLPIRLSHASINSYLIYQLN